MADNLSSTSGAAKKRKLKKKLECLKKVPKLSKFLKPIERTPENPDASKDKELKKDDKEKMPSVFNDQEIHQCNKPDNSKALRNEEKAKKDNTEKIQFDTNDDETSYCTEQESQRAPMEEMECENSVKEKTQVVFIDEEIHHHTEPETSKKEEELEKNKKNKMQTDSNGPDIHYCTEPELESQRTLRNEKELRKDKEKMKVDCNADDKIDCCTEDLQKNIISITGNKNNESENGRLFSTDIADFEKKILSNDVKKMIILSDSSRPRGPFKRDPLQNNRKFSEKFYTSSTKYGFVERLWLCYSPKLDAVYCEPCWLFSNKSQDNWRTGGVRDWQGLSKKIKVHETSHQHVQSCCIYEKWKKNETIDKKLEEQIRYESNFWVQVLERLVNITMMLSKNCLSFRGHRESLEEEYNGNFLTQVQLLSKYDNVMRQVLNMPNGTTKYLSHNIQNEIIHCLATRLKATLVNDINCAPFYSIIMDTTQDITKKDQLSQVFRYVKIIVNEKENPTSIEIKEVFLGFKEIHNHTANGLYNETLQLLEKNDIKLSKCRGQAYDGANVMSGVYNGVQALLKRDVPYATYIHCASHNLNLVVNDAVKSCQKISAFFAILENIYTFFGNSVKRWDLLSKFTGESQVTLKKLNPTRWAGRHTSLLAVKLRFLDILKGLAEVALRSQNKDEREEALRLQKNMSTFEFVFITVLLSKILGEINLPSKLLQTKDLDLMAATEALQSASKNLKQYRNMYTSAKNEAIEIAAKWNIKPTFTWKRQKIVKKYFDELSSDHRFENEDDFRVNVFIKVIDVVINQIDNRFEGMHKISNLFSFMVPVKLIAMEESDILKSAEALQINYKEDLTAEFPIQMVQLTNTFREELIKISNMKEFAELLLIKFATISSSFTEVITALLLFLTLPVTVATAERSFSKLKIIKNYLRNSTSEERLHNLSILGIEAKTAKSMDTKDIIRDFANLKARKQNFKF